MKTGRNPAAMGDFALCAFSRHVKRFLLARTPAGHTRPGQLKWTLASTLIAVPEKRQKTIRPTLKISFAPLAIFICRLSFVFGSSLNSPYNDVSLSSLYGAFESLLNRNETAGSNTKFKSDFVENVQWSNGFSLVFQECPI